MKKRRVLRPRVLNILIILSLIGVLSSAYVLYSDNLVYRQGDVSYQQLRTSRVSNELSTEGSIQTIDFSLLKSLNSDLVGWIGTEDNEIDYPLVQGEDNEYYLTHLFTREKNKLGSIFFDYRNQTDFSDRNTIIYGHNMKDGSMFSSLIEYKNESYYLANPTLPIFTPDGNYLIEFFAGIVVDGSYESVQFDFQNDMEFMEYVGSLVEQSTFKSQTRISEQDRIVTLVTCSYEYQNARYALYGRIVALP